MDGSSIAAVKKWSPPIELAADREPQGTDTAAQLGWLVVYQRRIIVVATILVILLTYLIQVMSRRPPEYRGTAVVIGKDLGFSAFRLPRTASAVFYNGEVAETATRLGGLPYSAEDLIPERVRLVPIPDSVAVRVNATDPDPVLAAQLATAAAEALADKLNQAGDAIGQFSLVANARVPSSPIGGGSRIEAGLVGLIGGGGLAIGVLGFFYALRRPVISARRIASLTGAPLLGELAVDKKEARADVQRKGGLALLVNDLYPSGYERILFVGCAIGGRIRARATERIAKALSWSTPVFFVTRFGPESSRSPATLRDAPNVLIRSAITPGMLARPMPVVINGPSVSRLDLPQGTPPGARVVILVQEGTPEARLTEAVRRIPTSQLLGSILLRRVRPVSRFRRRAHSPRSALFWSGAGL